jgi:hypothetical protein
MRQVDLGSGYHECPVCKKNPDVRWSYLTLPMEGPTDTVYCRRCNYTSPRLIMNSNPKIRRHLPGRGRMTCECLGDYPEPQCPLHGGDYA